MDQEKRQHIIETAMSMFDEYGFHNTPTSKIAKRAGISVGTLFNYFPTKEDLIESIYQSIKAHTKEYFLSNLDGSKDDYELLRDLYTSIVIWGLENPREFKFVGLFTNSPFQNLKKDKTVTEPYSDLQDRISRILLTSNMCTSSKDFTIVYMNSAVRATTDYLLENEVLNESTFINSAFDLFWNGFARK